MMTPLDKVEVLYQHLVQQSYEGAKDAEVRAASKLLMVALYSLKEHEGKGWRSIVGEYMQILEDDAQRFEQFMNYNRSNYTEDVLVLSASTSASSSASLAEKNSGRKKKAKKLSKIVT